MLSNSWSNYSHYLSEDNLIAGFTNRYFPYTSANDRSEFAKILILDSKNIVIPKQVHSNTVTICTKAGNIDNSDGIVTTKKELILSIQVADCIPIFLFDIQNHNIGLVHAGWRGVYSGIIENSITQIKELDSKPTDIKVLLGPSIRQCCFEVGPEVSKLFNNKFQLKGKEERTLLDLQGVVVEKLINMNIQSNDIIDINECTCCSDKYHSFRRDGDKAGRMIAMFGRKNN
jgi:YfiH family protein